jgi:sterol desaturase/sphingolipid hydroxylase (fatty acid hydroxylase superfamily)
MGDAPHIVVRAFERLVLFPLNLCVLVGGVIFLIEKAWLFGAFLLSMSFFLGMVGLALPHRKKQTARQLYSQNIGDSQNIGERFGDITHEESMGLVKSVMLAGFLVSIITAGTALHKELPWYWVLGYFVGAWAVFPLGSILFCLAWAWMMEKRDGRARNPERSR